MSYCNAPWRRIFIDASGKKYPCCQFDRRGEYNLDEIKQKMLNREPVKQCERCDVQSQSGEISLREQYNKLYGYPLRPTIRDVEIGVDNVCNLQCLICSSRSSHKWFDVENKLFGDTVSPTKYQQHEEYKTIDWKNVRSLHLYGGEPFYSPNVETMLDYISNKIDWKNFKLSGSTNCTRMPKDSLLEKIKSCKEFRFNLSIDGYGKINDYSRKGSNWNDVLENMRKWHTLAEKHDNILIEVFSTVSIYTANMYDKLEEFIRENFPHFKIVFQHLQVPEWLCISNTPLEYKQMVKQYTTNETILKVLDVEGPDLFDQFVYFTNKVNPDGLEEANPNLYKFMKNYELHDCKDAIVQKIREYKV